MSKSPVTLQISLAPSDARHAGAMLDHQVNTWRDQVSEILLTIDLHRSRGRFSAGWHEGREKIVQLARSVPGVRVLEVDYSREARQTVAREFFGGKSVPEKDCRGGPYYAYFFGLSAASHDYVLHSDSDIFFGGRSRQWLGEAVGYLSENRDVLFAAPLPGPPHPENRLVQLDAVRDSSQTNAYFFGGMSTRLFLFSRNRFRETIGALRPLKPRSPRKSIIALLDGNPLYELPEDVFTIAMRENGLRRRDFLGSPPGMWSLHPPYRSEDFYIKLPEIVSRIENGDLPDAQLGDHDINSSLVDWTDAIKRLTTNRWWKRAASRLFRAS